MCTKQCNTTHSPYICWAFLHILSYSILVSFLSIVGCDISIGFMTYWWVEPPYRWLLGNRSYRHGQDALRLVMQPRNSWAGGGCFLWLQHWGASPCLLAVTSICLCFHHAYFFCFNLRLSA